MRILIFTILTLPIILMAQVPQGFTYQAVATDNNGLELVEQNISIRVSILSESSTGIEQWIETHLPITDGFGLFTITIGEGISTGGGAQSSFSNIDWGNSTHYLKIEMDIQGGSNYQLLGTSQLMSVPYALHAETSDQGNNQSEQIDSLETIIQQLTNSLNSLSSASGSGGSGTGSFYTICDIGYNGNSILNLGEKSSGLEVRELKYYDSHFYVIYSSFVADNPNSINGVNLPTNSAHIIVKYDLTGNVLWQRSAESSVNYQRVKLKEKDNFCYVLFSNDSGSSIINFTEDFNLQSANSSGHLFKISSDGNFVNYFDAGPYADFELNNSYIYYVSNTELRKLDLDFNIINFISLTNTTFDNYIFKNSVNNNIYIISKSNNIDVYSPELNFLWGKGFYGELEYTRDYPVKHRITFLNSNVIFLNNDHSIDATYRKIYSYDENGNLNWSHPINVKYLSSSTDAYANLNIISNEEDIAIIEYFENIHDQELLEIEINGGIYNGNNNFQYLINSSFNIVGFNELNIPFEYSQGYRITSINENQYARLLQTDYNICFNDSIYPPGNIYLINLNF